MYIHTIEIKIRNWDKKEVGTRSNTELGSARLLILLFDVTRLERTNNVHVVEYLIMFNNFGFFFVTRNVSSD